MDGPGFECRGGGAGGSARDFFFYKTSRQSVGPIPSPIQWLERIYSEVKRPADDLDTHCHPTPKLRLNGVKTLLPVRRDRICVTFQV